MTSSLNEKIPGATYLSGARIILPNGKELTIWNEDNKGLEDAIILLNDWARDWIDWKPDNAQTL